MLNRRKVNTNDILFERFKNYKPKIKLTIKLNPKEFLDLKFIYTNVIYNTMVNKKSTKLLIPWLSKVPTRYEHSDIIGNLHQSKIILLSLAD